MTVSAETDARVRVKKQSLDDVIAIARPFILACLLINIIGFGGRSLLYAVYHGGIGLMHHTFWYLAHAWMALPALGILIAQSVTALRIRRGASVARSWHRKLGRAAALYLALWLILGVFTVLESFWLTGTATTRFSSAFFTAALGVVGGSFFLLALWHAIRRRHAAHIDTIVFAMIWISSPGLLRVFKYFVFVPMTGGSWGDIGSFLSQAIDMITVRVHNATLHLFPEDFVILAVELPKPFIWLLYAWQRGIFYDHKLKLIVCALYLAAIPMISEMRLTF